MTNQEIQIQEQSEFKPSSSDGYVYENDKGICNPRL